MKLDVLTKQQCEQVRLWRNDWLYSLRTPYPLIKEMQEKFYQDVVCNPNAPHRYWAILLDDSTFIGMGGIINIELENRRGEISLIINPSKHHVGYGPVAAALLLKQAFFFMNLDIICGECYLTNKTAVQFWHELCSKHKGNIVNLPDRKYWDGRYWDAMYFSIRKEDYVGLENTSKPAI